ncbi:MAG: hypothetical protein FJ100_23750 [Deltaproteobacteria bacterium]|nr:hypothetical protein [Deltaproteobacteria bacterium]
MRALLLAVLLAGCAGPIRCHQASIVVQRHPDGLPRPAGQVTVGCDGAVVVQIAATQVDL